MTLFNRKVVFQLKLMTHPHFADYWYKPMNERVNEWMTRQQISQFFLDSNYFLISLIHFNWYNFLWLQEQYMVIRIIVEAKNGQFSSKNKKYFRLETIFSVFLKSFYLSLPVHHSLYLFISFSLISLFVKICLSSSLSLFFLSLSILSSIYFSAQKRKEKLGKDLICSLRAWSYVGNNANFSRYSNLL